MEADGANTGDGGLLGSLLQALVEITGEGVVAFDREGRVAYASPSAQTLLRGLSTSAVTAAQLAARLVERGGRRVPLTLGAQVLGEAIFLDSDAATGASLAARERRAILETLQATGGRLSAAARNLGISRTTLWRRLRAYGMQRKP